MADEAARRDTVIDPSPVHQAVEEMCAEYERRIAELERQLGEKQS